MVGIIGQKISHCNILSDILDCASIVRRGGVIIFPTDTVYGIGCDPFNDVAVRRIFDIKGRERNKPLPILAATIESVRNIVKLDLIANTLARKYWPGRLTIVCPQQDNRISSLVSANTGKIAIRIPGNTCALELLRKCIYLIGTSANRSGEEPVRDISQIKPSPLPGVDAILSGGYIAYSKESTIIDVSKQGHPDILRSGAIASDEIFNTLYSEGLIDKTF
ncbi:MAG: L-threonylcarbamoyladenylate synthase [Thermoproteota archaeon]|nr:L-threonylcarbamoyladenylate synthase [Thermoproteota archaeon]